MMRFAGIAPMNLELGRIGVPPVRSCARKCWTGGTPILRRRFMEAELLAANVPMW